MGLDAGRPRVLEGWNSLASAEAGKLTAQAVVPLAVVGLSRVSLSLVAEDVVPVGRGDTQPRVAIVGWHPAPEIEYALRAGSGSVRYVVVSFTLDPSLEPLVEWRRIPYLPVSSFRMNWVIFFLLGGLRVRRLQATVVHAFGPTPVVPNDVQANTVTFCQAAHYAATKGTGIRGRGIGWQVGEQLALLLERWWFTSRVGLLVALSPGAKAELLEHYPNATVAVVPCAVDLARFRPNPRERERTRAELGVRPDEVVVLFVDQSYRSLKGLDLVLEAFARAREPEGGPGALWIIGDGNDALRPLAVDLGIDEQVRFLGYRTDIERFYCAADVFVNASIYETFCRAAHEAAATRLPVVAPPLSGIRDLVGDDEAGLCVRRDAGEIGVALRRLASDARLREQLGEKGLARASAYDATRVGSELVALHEALARQGSSPPGSSHSG